MSIQLLHKKLINKRLTISVAESCTGGLLAHNLTKLANSSKYFQDGFRFRFNSYGSLNGSLDHWNLDYVYFNESRSMNDTLMQDWAFTSPPVSMLDNYSSVPWKHFKNTTSDILLKNAIIPSYNSSDNPKLLQPCSMDLFYEDILQSSFPYSATVLNVPELSSVSYTHLTLPTTPYV